MSRISIVTINDLLTCRNEDKGQQLTAPLFRKHSEDLEKLMSVLDANELQQMYGPLKKLGLAATHFRWGDAATEK